MSDQIPGLQLDLRELEQVLHALEFFEQNRSDWLRKIPMLKKAAEPLFQTMPGGEEAFASDEARLRRIVDNLVILRCKIIQHRCRLSEFKVQGEPSETG